MTKGLFYELINDDKFVEKIRSLTHKSSDDWLWSGPVVQGIPFIQYNGNKIHVRNLYYYCYTGVVDRRRIRMSCNNKSFVCVNPFHMNKGPGGPYQQNYTPNNIAYLGGSYKLVEGDIIAIRDMYDKGRTQTAIAELYGVHPSNISNIVRNKTWFGTSQPIEYKTIFKL